jgi:hypothetical protein
MTMNPRILPEPRAASGRRLRYLPNVAPDPDPTRCPLCGGPNRCALAAPREPGREAPPCWCRAERFPAELLARVPEAQRRRACICRACRERAAAAAADSG